MLVSTNLPGPRFKEVAICLAVFDFFRLATPDEIGLSWPLTNPHLLASCAIDPFTTGYLFLSPQFECQVTVASRKIHSRSLHCEILDHTWPTCNKVSELMMAAQKEATGFTGISGAPLNLLHLAEHLKSNRAERSS